MTQIMKTYLCNYLNTFLELWKKPKPSKFMPPPVAHEYVERLSECWSLNIWPTKLFNTFETRKYGTGVFVKLCQESFAYVHVIKTRPYFSTTQKENYQFFFQKRLVALKLCTLHKTETSLMSLPLAQKNIFAPFFGKKIFYLRYTFL